ncbi:MAG: DUF4878 domain-containing protein [Clostridiales bacterium]|mgnify:CR=1 FL=1|nr:DUF4878 domain-containing protein [Clostridiales bacterium]
MKKKSFFAVLLALSLIFLAACGNASSPEKAVEAYCKALKASDAKSMTKYMGDDSKEAGDPYEGYPASVSKVFKANLEQMKYEVGTAKIQGDTTLVKVKFEYKSAANIFRASVQEFLKRKTTGSLKFEEGQSLEDYLVKIFEEKEKELESKDAKLTVDFECIKTSKGWQISSIDDEIYNIMFSGFFEVEKEISALFELDSLPLGD